MFISHNKKSQHIIQQVLEPLKTPVSTNRTGYADRSAADGEPFYSFIVMSTFAAFLVCLFASFTIRVCVYFFFFSLLILFDVLMYLISVTFHSFLTFSSAITMRFHVTHYPSGYIYIFHAPTKKISKPLELMKAHSS